jgi:hypothetical protein
LTAYVLGHGSYRPGEETIVPAGMTLSFYAKPEESGVMNVLESVIANGGAGPQEVLHEGTSLPNYDLTKFEDDHIGRFLELNRHNLELWFIGDQVRSPTMLCMTPAQCHPDDHRCDGVFGKARLAGEKDLHIMACRFDITAASHGFTRSVLDDYGTEDTSADDELRDWTSRFLGLSAADQDAFWAGMAHEEQVYVTSDVEMAEWAEMYEARRVLAQAHQDPQGYGAFYQYYDTLSQVIQARLLRDYPDVAAVITSHPNRAPSQQLVLEVEDFLVAAPEDQDGYWKLIWEQKQDLPQALEYLRVPRFQAWARAYDARAYIGLGMTPVHFRDLFVRVGTEAQVVLAGYPEVAAWLIKDVYPDDFRAWFDRLDQSVQNGLWAHDGVGTFYYMEVS